MDHTPGPWKVDHRIGCLAVYPASREVNCFSGIERSFVHYLDAYREWDPKTEAYGPWIMEPENEANARLIAAAPTMYTTLKYLHKWIDGLYHESKISLQQAENLLWMIEVSAPWDEKKDDAK